MNIGAVSTASLASAVWSAATRSLTNTGAQLSATGGAQATLAAASQVDLRAGAGFLSITSVAIQKASGTGNVQLGLFDGTNFITFQSASGTTGIGADIATNSSQGAMLKNTDASIAATYIQGGIKFLL